MKDSDKVNVAGRNARSSYDFAMLRANKLSQNGLGLTAPNPIVGAVILDSSGLELANGFHAGGDHAEIVAIKNARTRGIDDFSECTLVVTLEPCNHHGKTPPCSESIIKAGFKRVVYAVSDPNQIASGGAAKLQSSKIEVISGVQSEYVSYTNRAWLHKVNHARPWIVSKIAATIDGKIAASDGTSKWITAEKARADVARMRLQSDAILTSTATVLADDSQLIPRGIPELKNHGNSANPVRIVMGTRELPSDLKIFDNAAETQLLKTHDFSKLLDSARDRGWNQIMVEAGAQLNTALIKSGLIDELVIYVAPSILATGKNLVNDLGISTLVDRKDFSFGEIRRVGRDLRIQLLAKDSIYAGIFEQEVISGGVN